MFALGCFDAFITLPVTATGLITNIIEAGQRLDFYQGWTFIHSDWDPELFPKSIWSTIKWGVFTVHWDEWINPFFALVFFALFGFTLEAKEGYRKLFRFLGRPFGVRQADSVRESLPEMFGNDGGANTTVTSNVSSRYGQSNLYARRCSLT